jgi:hypothetical protein
MPSYQLIFFVLALICAAPVLFWYYRRHNHPRFRPKLGEMAMVTLFVVLLSLGGSMLLGGLMDDPDQFRPDAGMGAIPTGMGTVEGGGGMERERSRNSSKSKESGSRDRSGGGGEQRGSERR